MKRTKNELTINNWFNQLTSELRKEGKTRTSGTYSDTIKSFMLFRKGKDVRLKDINANLLLQYQRFLTKKGLVPNSTSFYMRILRAAYNKACEQGYATPQAFLFKRVYTGVSKTAKRAISLSDISHIKDLPLEDNSQLAFARDMFMFSFYTRGMSFVDMAFLKRRNLQNGYLTYRRQKTGQLLTIKWEPCMQEIVNHYHSTPPYLLPIIRQCSGNLYRKYQSRLAVINRYLKVISLRTGLPIPLSMYVARHSWATCAQHADVPIEVISKALGHESERTTRIYLATIEASKIDEANKRLLALI